MEIILLQDFPQLGFIGEQHNVKKGYARNYLIPRGIAIESSSRNANQLKHRMAMINARKAKKRQEAEALAERLQQVELQFKLKVGEGGKSFGSVGTRDIEAALQREGYQVNKKQLSLTEAMKSVGEFSVAVRLHSDVQARVKVHVIAEKVVEAKPKEEEQEGRGRRRARRGEDDEESAAAPEETPGEAEAADAAEE